MFHDQGYCATNGAYSEATRESADLLKVRRYPIESATDSMPESLVIDRRLRIRGPSHRPPPWEWVKKRDEPSGGRHYFGDPSVVVTR